MLDPKSLFNSLRPYTKWFVLGVLVFMVVGVAFYWYGWRPSVIKKECSWVERHSDASPGRPGKTKEEIDSCNAECKAKYSGGGVWNKLNQQACFCDLFAEPEPPTPAKDWWEKATTTQYNFCIHSKGL